MNLVAKKRILYAALLAVTVWPIGQMGLVAHYDISAWRLAGWGMYSEPHSAPGLRVNFRDETGWHPVSRASLAPWLRELSEMRKRRKVLGRLATPDTVARQILTTAPGVDGVEIIFISPILDPRTEMVSERSDSYRYERPEDESPLPSSP